MGHNGRPLFFRLSVQIHLQKARKHNHRSAAYNAHSGVRFRSVNEFTRAGLDRSEGV